MYIIFFQFLWTWSIRKIKLSKTCAGDFERRTVFSATYCFWLVQLSLPVKMQGEKIIVALQAYEITASLTWLWEIL